VLAWIGIGCVGGGWSVFMSESTSDVDSATIEDECGRIGGVFRLEEMIDSSLVCSERSDEM